MADDIAALAALLTSGDEQRFRLRQGTITAVASDGTCTVTIAGDTDNPISEVNYASTVCPVPGAGCWIATDGDDLFVVATMAPYGNAWGQWRRNNAQAVPNASWTGFGPAPANRVEEFYYGTVYGSGGLQVLVPGLWRVTTTPAFVSNSAGVRASRITLNGAAVLDGITAAASGAITSRVSANGVVKCAIGDIIAADVYQTSGGSLNTDTGAGTMIFQAEWIGPTPV